MICFYHNADFDGICSAALIKNYFDNNWPKEECHLYGINHGDIFPMDLIDNIEVVMVDFSLTREKMIEVKNRSKFFTWIDHHKSAIDDMKGIEISGMQELDLAGCELTWMYYTSICDLSVMPKVVKLLGRYDVWDHANPEVCPFQEGFTLHAHSPEDEIFKFLFADHALAHEKIKEIINEGSAIVKYNHQQNRKYAENAAFFTMLKGPDGKVYNAIAINRLQSGGELFDSVWDRKKYDIMIAFGSTGDGWNISLRSEASGPDVAKIAKYYGGGGHPCASGFRAKDLSFQKGGIFHVTL